MKRFHLTRLPIALAFALGFCGCKTVPLTAPEWTITGQSPDYPDASYLTASGMGQTQAKARQNAAKALRERISVQIESQFQKIIESTFERRGQGNKNVFKEWVRSQVRMRSEAVTVFDIKWAKGWQDPRENTFHVLGVIDRRSACKELRRKIEKGRKDAAEYYKESEKRVAQSEFALAIQNLFRAWDAALPLSIHETAFNIIGKPIPDMKLPPSNAPTVTQIVERLEDIVSHVRLDVVSGDKQEGEFGEALPQPLKLRVVLAVRGGAAPVRHFPVLFQFLDGTGELSEEVYTDADGMAVCHVLRTDASGKETNRIRAWLGFEKLYKQAKDLLPVDKTLTYQLPTRSSTTVLVKIVEKIGDRRRADSVVQNEIIKALGPKGAGFKILTRASALAGTNPDAVASGSVRDLAGALRGAADILIVGSAVSKKWQRVDAAQFGAVGGGGVSYVINRTRLSLRAIHVKKAKVLAAIDMSGEETESGGPNEEQAGKRGLRKLAPKVAQELRAKLEALYPPGKPVE